MKKRILIALSITILLLSALTAQISDDDKRALALANYFSVQSQKIVENSYNRVILEETYQDFENNLTNKLDNKSRNQLLNTLDSIGKFRNIAFEREHLQILFENAQAEAINNALPNPGYLLSAVMTGNLRKTLVSCVMMGLDSISNYNSAKNTAVIEYLNESWSLDADERNEIVNIQKSIISYLIDTVNDSDSIGGFDLLSSSEVEDYVKFENLTNPYQRKNSLEANEDIYLYYGPYWGLRAKTYYELKDYKNCLYAIQKYENLRADVFDKDREFAEALPFAICSIEEIYKNDIKTLENEEAKYLNLMEQNIKRSNWMSRTFISQFYISLANRTKNSSYLEKAYKLVKEDLNTTAIEQEQWFANYTTPVNETIAKAVTKSELKKRKEEIRKEKQLKSTQFIPYHEGFLYLYSLYNDLSKQLNISDKEREEMWQVCRYSLSVIECKNYVVEEVKDDELYNHILELSPEISDRKAYDAYNLFNFRKKFDAKKMDDSELLKEIIDSESKNYYLPSLTYSSCYVDKKSLLPSLTNFPACLLSDDCDIAFILCHFDENDNQIFDVEKYCINKDLYFIESIKDEYISYENSPIYFKYIDKMWFNNNSSEKVNVTIEDNIDYYAYLYITDSNGFFCGLCYSDPFNNKPENFIYSTIIEDDE